MIYFDHASTSHPKPLEILQGMALYLSEIGASPGRGEYSLSNKGEEIVQQTREALALEFSIKHPKQIFFTLNATHALNILIKGFLKPGDHVLISNFEHNAVLRPLHKLEQEGKITYSVFHSDEQGIFDLSLLEKSLQPNTKLLIANHASNVIGVLSPIEKFGEFAKKNGIHFLVDVSQTAGLIPLNIEKINVDFIAGTGHKNLLGPSGVGFFYAKNPDLVDTLYEGGSGVNSASKVHPHSLPVKFEAGTLNYLGIVGLLYSLRYLNDFGKEIILEKMKELTQYALQGLKQIPGIQIYGTQDIEQKIPVISFNLSKFFPGEVMHLLSEKGICIRGGLQCSPLIHHTIKTFPQGTIRMSFGHNNSFEELDHTFNVLKELVR